MRMCVRVCVRVCVFACVRVCVRVCAFVLKNVHTVIDNQRRRCEENIESLVSHQTS